MKILVPTDFSENAFHAAVYALSLAKEKPGSLLHLVHVVNPVITDVLVITDVERESNLLIERICVELRARCSSCVISASVKVGDTVDELLKEAENVNAGIIAIGLQGAGKAKRFLFGSYALSLLHKSTFPLLIVPEISILAVPRRIVFASDYYNSDVEALHQVIPIAKTFGAEIKIVHLFEDKADAPIEAGLLQLIRSEVLKVIDYPRLAFRIFNSNNIALGIKNFCEVMEADLLILSTPKRNFLERLFHKSITKDLTYDSPIPLLIFHVRKM